MNGKKNKSTGDPSHPEEGKSRPKPSPLSKLIAAILRDVAQAQNMSNLYTVKLAKISKKDPLLIELPVPNGLFHELELDLHLGILDVSWNNNTLEDFIIAANESFKVSSHVIAGDITKSFANAILSYSEVSKENAELLENITDDPIVYYLASNITRELISNQHYLLDSRTKKLDLNRTAQVIKDSIETYFFKHPDIRKLPQIDELIEVSRKLFSNRMKNWLEHIESGLDAVQTLYEDPTLEVITDSPTVQAISPEASGSLRIKVELRDYTWVVNVEKTSDGMETTSYRLVPAEK